MPNQQFSENEIYIERERERERFLFDVISHRAFILVLKEWRMEESRRLCSQLGDQLDAKI